MRMSGLKLPLPHSGIPYALGATVGRQLFDIVAGKRS